MYENRDFSSLLPENCWAFGSRRSITNLNQWRKTWSTCVNEIISILVLAGSKTAEIKGVSAAGATKESRRYTALADAELLLRGPSTQRRFALPPLPAGVSPALISYVCSRLIGIEPRVVCAGLLQTPSFPCVLVDSQALGPSECLTTGKAMDRARVDILWEKGLAMGLNLEKPLLLSECVPGGTTTALAILTGLGIPAFELISTTNRNSPKNLKKSLVEKGLRAAALNKDSTPKDLLAAVGDPFQAFSAGLLLGTRQASHPVLLAGGGQMLAVLAIALASIEPSSRDGFVKDISVGTTAWLADECISPSKKVKAFPHLLELIENYFDISLLGLSSGLHFYGSSKTVLRDYELGFVKEGVGAGALILLAQNQGISCKSLIENCEFAVDELSEFS